MSNNSLMNPRPARPARGLFSAGGPTRLRSGVFALAAFLALASGPAAAQTGSGYTLFGDVKVDERNSEGNKPLSLDVILYYTDGRVFSRQRIPSNGRYRFFGLRGNDYDLVVEVESQEVARVRVSLGGGIGPGADVQKDIELEWKGGAGAGTPARKLTVSAADFYQRPAANQSLFEKAQGHIDKKNYGQAAALLRQILDSDANDFQAWTELGTVSLLQNKSGEAEKAYARAVEARPSFFLALINLGRVRAAQKKFEEAAEALTRAVEVQPESAEANLLLGETYLQLRKGSKAVAPLNEAARLGRPEAHLRLATLYHAVGQKDKAAAEYEQFLAKEPGHPDRAKLEQYIAEHKKQN
jgi:Tfp pilus assembly protein PilF